MIARTLAPRLARWRATIRWASTLESQRGAGLVAIDLLCAATSSSSIGDNRTMIHTKKGNSRIMSHGKVDWTLTEALDVARVAARQADEIAMNWFGKGLAVEQKADASPVTEADVPANARFARPCWAAFPTTARSSARSTVTSGESRFLWLVDPIDGTRSFIRGLPFWSVQIGLMVDGELVLGVSSAPAFDETAWAVKGAGRIHQRPDGA